MQERKKTKILCSPPQSWDELTWEQLQYIFSFNRGNMPDIEYKMHIFLHIMGWELVKKSYISLPQNDATSRDVLTAQERSKLLSVRLNEIEAALDGDFDITIIVRDKGTKELYEFSLMLLVTWIKNYMSFLDSPEGFTSLPEEKLQIGRKVFLLPQAELSNITYQQYTSAQNALESVQYWGIELEALLKEQIQGVPKEDGGERQTRIREYTKNMESAKAEFLAHLLTPSRFIFFDTSNGHLSLSLRSKYEYDADRAWEQVSLMRKATGWLFNVCYYYFQGCLYSLRKKFPSLFTDKKGMNGKDMLVAELDSINAIMKYQSYANQQSVYDSNALFVLSILNTMTVEAKEMEKLNLKSKGKK